ncbi:response regulator [bacterium]|nr:response regulator [bacterium]
MSSDTSEAHGGQPGSAMPTGTENISADCTAPQSETAQYAPLDGDYTLWYYGSDRESAAKLFSRLQQEPYKVCAATSLQQLRSAFAQDCKGADVIIADLTCPEVILEQLAEALRLSKREKRTAVLALIEPQSRNDEHFIGRCYAHQVRGFLCKPLRLASVKTAMRLWCSRLSQEAYIIPRKEQE